MRRCVILLLALTLAVGCGRGTVPPERTPAAEPPPASTAPVVPEPSSSAAPPSQSASVPPPASQPPTPPVADPLDQLEDEPEPDAVTHPSEEAPPPEEQPQEPGEGEEASDDIPPAKAQAGGETRDFWQIREDMVARAAAFREVNPDAVGWLYLYDTTIDSPVFQLADDNNYYLKHNDYKQPDVNGAIVSDYRNRLTGRDSQSQNLVLYAHSKDENPDGGVEASREFEHFTELKRYQRQEFCEARPYFLFATPEESMVFEVFAAFHTKTSFVYNTPEPSRQELEDILAEAKRKSLFDFGVEVTADDRIMTLSTCCRRIVPTYPNGYRFVVMGRLVEAGKPLQYKRVVTVNPTALTPGNIYE
ncbi:MAG: class B sortase [Angelakisella sp.]|nr:class B sortase [Angelakisella sp.]